MTQETVIGLMREALLVALKLSAPMLLVSVFIGLLVAIFQAATQIHEQTLTFVPKLIVIAFLLLFTSSWMITVFTDYVDRLFMLMRTI